MTRSPAEAQRRWRTVLALEALVFGILLVHGASRLAHTLGPPPPLAPGAPPPIVVDVVHDPPERLEHLPGVGRVRAKAIVAERRRGGAYRSLEDLVRVHGIGEVTVRRIRAAREVRPRANGIR